MSVDQMAKDGIDVIEYVRQRLHKEKVILYGTSWGTILGTTIAQRRPELLYAYVGSGQVVNMVAGENIGYDTFLRRVKQIGDAKAVAALWKSAHRRTKTWRRLEQKDAGSGSMPPPLKTRFEKLPSR